VKRALALFLSVSFWSSAAAAQSAQAAPEAAAAVAPERATPVTPMPETDDKDAAGRARDLGREGLSAYGESRYQEALNLFLAADSAFHSPVFQLFAARCLLELDRSAEAQALLERITKEELPRGAPEPWSRARSEAERELARLREPPAPKEGAQPSGELPQNFDADGVVVRRVTAMPEPPPEPDFSRERSTVWTRSTPNQRAALVAFGTGAIGLVFAIVTGGMALERSAHVRENCMGTSCRPEDLPLAQEATLLANVATVGAAIAIAGGTTGTVLWLLPTSRADGSVALVLSGPSLRLAGTF